MAILPILTLPDKRLRTVAKPVESVDDSIRQLAEDMLETMYAAPGIGLAATQVNRHVRLVVMDVSEEKNQPLVFVNPKITWSEGEQVCEEGCLSVPDIYAKVKRAERIKVSAQDKNGTPFELEADGLLAVCIQHELDHLDGVVFLDRLSPLKRKMALKKLKKQTALVSG